MTRRGTILTSLFRHGSGSSFSPLRSSLLLTGIYLVAGIFYIVVSTHVAAGAAETLEDLKRIEAIKGTLYIIFTGALLMAASFFLLRRIARSESSLARHREALIIAESRAAAGLMAASIAHDINNVLSVIQYAADRLTAPDREKREYKDLTSSIQASSSHLRKLASRLTETARKREVDEFKEVELGQIAEEARRAATIHKRDSRCRIDLQCESPLNVFGNQVVLQQMLLNLLLNAVDAASHNGHVLIRIRKDGRRAMLEVHDSGPGVSAKQEEEVFQPFYSTKPDGTGLGLLSVLNCAEALGGRVWVEASEKLGGACFCVRLPLREETQTGVPHLQWRSLAGRDE